MPHLFLLWMKRFTLCSHNVFNLSCAHLFLSSDESTEVNQFYEFYSLFVRKFVMLYWCIKDAVMKYYYVCIINGFTETSYFIEAYLHKSRNIDFYSLIGEHICSLGIELKIFTLNLYRLLISTKPLSPWLFEYQGDRNF